MKIAKLTSLIVSVAVLSACGGGGNSNNSGSPITKQENANKQESQSKSETNNASQAETRKDKESTKDNETAKPVEPTNSVKPTNPTESTNIISPSKESQADPKFIELRQLPLGEVKNEDVGFGIVTGYNNKYSFNGAWKEKKEKDQLTELVLNGIKVKIATSLKGVGGLAGYALSEAFTSAWNVINDDGSQRDVFYFGSETPLSVMENQKGKAIYKGNATRYDNIKGELANVGSSAIYVDFDTKKIKGELDIRWPRRNISLKEADIRGNQFTGKALAGEDSLLWTTREGHYEGKFFGPNAEEVSGVARFKGNANIGKLEDLNTSFSAEKQKEK
ncbi:hypothetical protein A1D29_08370 [Pasteurellaceae bacterium Orientalotternb1]|nr:hypothetical protein A1D29_08370 [Pasteurellaceae bacterium Orientalotternb1]